MPVYLCCPGKNKNEPWNHFIQVYASPFELIKNNNNNNVESESESTKIINQQQPQNVTMSDRNTNEITITNEENHSIVGVDDVQQDHHHSKSTRRHQQQQQVVLNHMQEQYEIQKQQSIRRIRHSEIIIVDDVCIAYNLYWLRIRWPGKNNNTSTSTTAANVTNHFAGYIAMEGSKQGISKPLSIHNENTNTNTNDEDDDNDNTMMLLQYNETTNTTTILSVPSTTGLPIPTTSTSSRSGSALLGSEQDLTRTNNNNDKYDDNMMMMDHQSLYYHNTSSNNNETTTTPKIICRRTGLIYPSSKILQLLYPYDDGISYISTQLPHDETTTSNIRSRNSMTSNTNIYTENVFCRICREGLHEDADEELPAAAADTTEVAIVPSTSSTARTVIASIANPTVTTTTTSRTRTTATTTATTGLRRSQRYTNNPLRTINRPISNIDNINDDDDNVIVDNNDDDDDEYMDDDMNRNTDTENDDDNIDGLLHPPNDTIVLDTDTTSTGNNKKQQYVGPIETTLLYSANTEALQNPMLKPCECSGSMAFVHYLCIEQWRCRSRHPKAMGGLQCETCNKPYGLPPPTERRTYHNPNNPNIDAMFRFDGQQQQGGGFMMADEWLDAMPPHVMQALRQPHIWWQIGAYIVRKRYLRPIVPIIMSPIVAIYCRARRLLKKRGVARRRWACSLCRRRARWKCVRCLRSYYCSRQCQNVSWHIIHKHVCYKPIRFWSSIVVYGCLTLLLLPGIIRDPLMYDIIICIIPLSFIIMGILGGGIATIIKKCFKYDIRGRMMELMVVIATVWLSMITWGLVQGFFSIPSPTCYGTFGTFNVTSIDIFPNLKQQEQSSTPATIVVDDNDDTSKATSSISTFGMMINTGIVVSRYYCITLLRIIRTCILQPAQTIYKTWDYIFLNSFLRRLFCSTRSNMNTGSRTSRFLSLKTNGMSNTTNMIGSNNNSSYNIITEIRNYWNLNKNNNYTSSSRTRTNNNNNNNQTTNIGCFEHISNANANFFISNMNGTSSSTTTSTRTTTSIPINGTDINIGQYKYYLPVDYNQPGYCASDLVFVFTLYCCAGITLIGSILYKHHERRQRHHRQQQHQQQRVHHHHHHHHHGRMVLQGLEIVQQQQQPRRGGLRPRHRLQHQIDQEQDLHED